MSLIRSGPVLKQQSVPRYRQIEAILRDQIWSGELAAGDQVPTEDELGKMFQVSRPTVRQALQILEQDKLIYREAGRGTFVNDIVEELPLERRLIHLTDLIDLEEPGDIEIQRTGTLAARGNIQKALGVEYGEEVFYFVRIYRSNDKPFGGAKVHVPLNLGRALSNADMLAPRLMDRLIKLTKLPIDHVDYNLDAVLADARTSAIFETHAGAPMISIRRTSFSGKRKPIEYSHMLFRSDLCRINFQQSPT